MFVGRAHERRRLARLLADARAGRSGAVLLVGDPGVGKTALLDRAVADAGGLTVLRAAGYELEADLPFAGLGALLRPLTARVPDLPGPQAAALGGALGLGPPPPVGDRFTAYAGALTLVADAAEAAPVLLAVDDVHWLDPASLDALAFVARRLAGEGVAILMAAREDPPAALERAPGIELMRVAGLDPPEAAALVRAEGDAGVDDRVADDLARATGGNPLALVAAVRSLTADQLAGRAPLPDHVPVGAAIDRAVAARLARLSDRTRRALLVAAAGEGGLPGLVGDALGAEGLADAFDDADVARLVEASPYGVRFRHPLVRSSVHRTAAPGDRRAAHAALARAARGRGDGALDDLARHLARAAEGPDEEAAAALEAAGRRAAARTAYAEGAADLRRAADLTPDPADRPRRLLEAAGLAMMAGRAGFARASVEACLAEARDPGLTAAARRARAHLELWTGNAPRAEELLVAEAERLTGVDDETAAIMLSDALFAAAARSDLGRARDLARRADAAAARGSAVTRCLVHIMSANGAALAGEPDAADRVARLPDPFTHLRTDDPLHWNRMGLMANAQLLVGALDEARTLLDRLGAVSRRLSAPSMLPYSLVLRAEVGLWRGDWDGSVADAHEALELGEATGQPIPAALARGVLARLAALRGDEVACRDLAGQAVRGVAEHGGATVAFYARLAEALLDLGLGRPEESLATLMRLDDDLRRVDLRCHPAMPYLPELVEVASRLGRAEVAAGALGRLRTLDPWGPPSTLTAVARCTGIVIEDPAEAVPHLRRAVDLADAAHLPFERSRAALILGERLHQARRREEARDALLEAHATFTALRAGPWAERAADGLGALGERPRVRGPEAVGTLTPRELQVARAAAAGRSDREIAADLFLSVRTVEHLVGSACGRLGIGSRAALVALLGGAAGRPGPSPS